MNDSEMSRASIAEYIERAKKAQEQFEQMNWEQVDLAVKTIRKVVYDNVEYLTEIAVVETNMGNVSDKIGQNSQKAKIV